MTNPAATAAQPGAAHGPTVAAFAGHMIDAPGRLAARFPASAEGAVRRGIDGVLSGHDVRAGVSALANGADVLFAEALLARRADLHVILPLEVEEFVAQSVRHVAHPTWERRFRDVLGRAATVEVFGDDYLRGSGSPFQLAALLIDGQAQVLARRRGWRALSLVVWDGEAGDGLGGTASFAGHAVKRGREVIGLGPITGQPFTIGKDALATAQKHTWSTVHAAGAPLEHRLGAMLFADAKGFSGLRETELPAFIDTVLPLVGAAVRRMSAPPLALNTWGDGLFVVTATPRDCALLALELVESAARLDWRAAKLPGPVGFRVGLHAGSVYYSSVDPLTGRANAYGRDVSRAARIEPAAALNQAWCSDAFLLLAAATGSEGLVFEDLGEVALAKNAGMMRLHRVCRGSA